ncbi:hypothetical protein M8818_003508 [Zalaria obscura]|uniref:Uncharacterized protein n=1 Tax=Zalaria obscura TaxID=2024903 RepID=A0ACC3SF21_9PEZI
MLQTSISAWLRKPAAVKEPPATKLSVNETSPAPVIAAELPLSSNLEAPKGQNGQPNEVVSSESVSNSHGGPQPPRAERRPLDPRITLEPCTKSNIASFKRLNSLLLPIPYQAKFYDEILAEKVASSITLLATWRDTPPSTATDSDTSPGRVVGGIRCRLIGSPPMLYISTLGVLSPYRTYGIASHLLQTVIVRAIELYGIKSVGAHVWEANEDGLEWYLKRGFREVEREAGYYRRLKPQGAVVLRREVGPGDLLRR